LHATEVMNGTEQTNKMLSEHPVYIHKHM